MEVTSEVNVEVKTAQEVEMAYRAARKIARSFVVKYNGVLPPTVDFDDYVQTGMVAWLEGRDMYWAMIRELRKALEFSKYSYKVKKMTLPKRVELTADVPDSGRDIEKELADQLDAKKIADRIYAIKDETRQFAMIAYFFLGMTLRDIGEVVGKSYEGVRTFLIEPELKRIREELK